MKKLIAVSLLIIAMPFMASVNGNQSTAYAGRISMGGYYCTCGCPDCICDPGETPLECRGTNSAAVADGGDSSTAKSSIDSASSLLLLAFTLLILFRLGFK